MTEIDTEQLKSRLVTGHKRDGRCVYDAAVKREVVRLCQQPGVSVAKMALRLGVNANVLRAWITQRKRKVSSSTQIKPLAHPATPAGNAPLQIASSQNGDVMERVNVAEAAQTPSAFLPGVRVLQAPSSAKPGLNVRLPNGVQIDVQPASLDELSSVMRILIGLPCSDSTSR
jgi:transposase-like protein